MFLDVPILINYGQNIYDNLPLLYAMAIGYGLSKKHSAIAVFSSVVFYIIFTATTEYMDPSNNLYILGGILSGLFTAYLYNWSIKLKFTGTFEIFNEKRIIPVLASTVALVLGIVIGKVWPSLAQIINGVSLWISESGPLGSFIYGLFNRLLLPFGLHHNLNYFLWYELGDYGGTTGDLHRFFAGDPNAGTYMTGYYLVMMFGLPALMYAFYRNVYKQNRKYVRGLYLVSAVISISTGITEPIELLFLFLMPKLYILHAVMTGLAMAVTDILNIHVGFNFSAGLLDYIAYYNMQPHGIRLLLLGIVYCIIYYFMTKLYIRNIDFVAPGDQIDSMHHQMEKAKDYVVSLNNALGGEDNIKYIISKFTRYEIKIIDIDKISYKELSVSDSIHIIQINDLTYQIITSDQGKYLDRTLNDFYKDKVL